MYAKYQISTNTINNVNATATTINIPITLEYQIVDNAELIEQVFVKVEEQKAVNPILDYDKVRFLPVYDSTTFVDKISYNLNFLNDNSGMVVPTYYSTIGFDDADIKFKKNFFTESYLLLSFYDSDNPLTQNLVTQIEVYNHLSSSDYYLTTTNSQIAGQPKPSNTIPVNLVILNPLTNRSGYFEGYHIYAYKDEYFIDAPPKSLYMKASYINAKTGKVINMMTENTKYSIDQLIYKQYTKYNLFRNTSGFYYGVDTTYSNNVSYTNSSNPNLRNLTVNLYQIQVL